MALGGIRSQENVIPEYHSDELATQNLLEPFE